MGVLVHACNTSTLVSEAEALQQVTDKTGLQKIIMCSNVLIFHLVLVLIYFKDYFPSQSQIIFSY